MINKLKNLVLTAVPQSFLIHLRQYHYLNSLRRFSEEEEPDLAIVKHLAIDGDCVFDIGANVGWYTKVLSKLVGTQGTVLSAEPIPDTYRVLSYCVTKLGLKNVHLLNCGISDEAGDAIMEIPLYESGAENYYKAQISKSPQMGATLRRVKISVRSLDSLASNCSKQIAFIKCDVEGHELQVLKGATGLLAKQQPAWLMEISGNPDRPGDDAWHSFGILNKYHYSAWWYDGKLLRKRRAGDRSINYFFLTPQHLASLDKERLLQHP